MKNEEMVLRKRAHSFVDVVSGIKIRSQVTLNRANAMIIRIKGVREEIKLFFADPIDKTKESKRAAAAAYQSIVAKKDEVEEPLVNAEKAIKGKISVYLLAEEEKRAEAGRERDRVRREAEEKAEALRAKGHHEEADEVEDDAPAVYVKPKPQMTGIHSRENWKFRIIDVRKIPHHYMMPNEKMIREEVQHYKGGTNIPGIEAYKDMIIAKSRG